jgi:Ca2+-binding RTX toxin-like protein
VANYFFETMTQAQASSFLNAADRIVFSSGSASQATVLFNPLTFSGPPTITITYGGISLVFADDPTSVRGQGFTLFPDGSKLFIGLATNDVGVTGTAGGDALFGGDGNDVMDAGAGNDLLQGNQGNDVLTGGTGLNTIFGGQGDDSIILTGGGTSATATNFGQGNLGNDIVVFADTSADGHITTADDAIILTGRTLADLLASDFI